MKISEWLTNTTQLLESASTTPQLDAEVILGHTSVKDRTWIHTYPEFVLQDQILQRLNRLVQRRINGEPIAYITGTVEFYGREFCVNKHVLVPRPESEILIEMFKELLPSMLELKTQGSKLKVLDIGTGSGVLGITTALTCPDLQITATDISVSALAIATINAKTYDVDITFRLQNLLKGDNSDYDIIIANLPYVPIFMSNHSISREPKRALFSGADGLGHYRRLFRQLRDKNIKYVLTESLTTQHTKLRNIASSSGTHALIVKI